MSACYVILAHVTWALAREWALFIRAAKTVTWALTWEWALAQDTMVHVESLEYVCSLKYDDKDFTHKQKYTCHSWY